MTPKTVVDARARQILERKSKCPQCGKHLRLPFFTTVVLCGECYGTARYKIARIGPHEEDTIGGSPSDITEITG